MVCVRARACVHSGAGTTATFARPLCSPPSPPSSRPSPPQEYKKAMVGAYESCGFMGERVIGFAYK